MITIYNDDESLLKQHHQALGQGDTTSVYEACSAIKEVILTNGDEGLIACTEKFDKVRLHSEDLFVTPDEIKAAYDDVPQGFIEAINLAKDNVTRFHEKQLPQNWQDDFDGGHYGQQYNPIERACLYVPGGRSPYPSTVIMNSVPAKIAGVKETLVATPPQPDGKIPAQILVAADICAVDQVLKAGGAQSIFAVAYGTQRIQKVDKIVGPGNQFVTMAKQMVYGQVDIDKPAGPSEVLVYIEDAAYAAYAASECLAQCEHDPDAYAIVISSDRGVLEKIQQEIDLQFNGLKRQEILKKSLAKSGLVLAADRTDAVNKINNFASEHLVLMVDDANDLKTQIKHAGSIFLGPYSPVAIGDYIAGPNHVLPTAGTARFASPLGVMDFMKYSSFVSYSKEKLAAVSGAIKELTQMEGFDAHQASVDLRLKS